MWMSGPESYRVYDVKIYNKDTNTWDVLDLAANYNMAGYNYTLRDLGDGFAMFDGAVNVLDYVMEDYMVLSNYVKAFDGGVIEASNSPLSAKYADFTVDYSNVNGSGRIELTEGGTVAESAEFATETVSTETPAVEKEGNPIWIFVVAVVAIAGAGIAVVKNKKRA